MSRGGSRSGAGRPGYRMHAEAAMRVDIRRWARTKYLVAGCRFTWSWAVNGEPSGSIGVRVATPERLTLEFAVRNGDARREVIQVVNVVWRPCNLGGARAFFACPACMSRAAILYLRSERFACRTCQRVAYRSQSEDWLGRAWLRQSKAEAKLADDWKRPAGMRKATHARLMEVILQCEALRDEGLTLALRRWRVPPR